VLIVLYPDLPQARDPSMRHQRLDPLEARLRSAGADRFVHVGRDPRWTTVMYRDGIHPNGQGAALLAVLIFESLGG